MRPTNNPDPLTNSDPKEERAPYHSPAILYEGTIDVRAGSPVIPAPPFGDQAPGSFDGSRS